MTRLFMWIAIAVLCLCVDPNAIAQDRGPKHPIDTWLEKEMTKNPSTAGQRDTLRGAKERWDVEMSKAYKRLLARFDSRSKSALISAQRTWISHRDAEFGFIDRIYMKKQGTMWLPMHDNDCMEVVRKRALQLEEYIKLLDE